MSSRMDQDIARIVTTVLADLSLAQAETHLGCALSKESIRSLRLGKVGREATIRTFASGFADRIREHYSAEVQGACGSTDDAAVIAWLAKKAGFGQEPEELADNLAALTQRSAEIALELFWERLKATGEVR